MRAWLIKWSSVGDHAAVEHPIVTVLSARTGAQEIRKYVERRYIEETASFQEMLSYAKYNKPTNLAYPVNAHDRYM